MSGKLSLEKSMVDAASAQEQVKSFILEECLPGADANELTLDTGLYSNKIVDLLATLKLVEFLELTFGISIAGYEIDAENFATISKIGEFIASKKQSA